MHAWHREFAAGVGATLSACTPEGEGAVSDAVFRGLLEWKPQRRAEKADRQVARWADGVNAKDLYLPVVTVQELEIGVRLTERRDPGQGAIFRTWMDRYVLPAFAGRILRVDLAVAQRSARLHALNPRPVRDGLT